MLIYFTKPGSISLKNAKFFPQISGGGGDFCPGADGNLSFAADGQPNIIFIDEGFARGAEIHLGKANQAHEIAAAQAAGIAFFQIEVEIKGSSVYFKLRQLSLMS